MERKRIKDANVIMSQSLPIVCHIRQELIFMILLIVFLTPLSGETLNYRSREVAKELLKTVF